ncbi:MAG TPA: hypothetical protein VFF67_01495 [Thermoplasmata archaeon]|nr:hypothetical protein [Thermoplasmata archaeon]
MSDDAIPSAKLPLSARSPGKCIVFGEHAVVHGGPELLLALDLYTQVGVAVGPETRLNHDVDGRRSNPYFDRALDRFWRDRPAIDVSVVSRVPRSAGLGSSAAFVAALGAALASASGGMSRPELAQAAFDIERGAQGVGSPGDTAATIAGGCVTVNSDMGTILWQVEHAEESWTVRRVPDPNWVWVVGYSGIPRNTATAVLAVGRRLAQPDGPSLLARFAEVAESGIRAFVNEDPESVGAGMIRNQELLREVGVSHPRLEALLAAAEPVALGAKLTGAGAGGSVLVLPRPGREMEVVRRLARAGAAAYAVRSGSPGADLVSATRIPSG